ncbi:tRNA adenosine(34) deaminase TadA [Paenibacillus donghaensis]|uniref:tRNA adenosine(34) deaminase TadA n=1 Tax=Paenibacillus donghaensis TaxID=414771 RepID=UPI001D1666CA
MNEQQKHPSVGDETVDKAVHERWMNEAIAQARMAEAIGEVPIGAVIVRGDEIIGRGYNLRETSQDATAHAEIVAIREASRAIGAWRLLECRLYVTLEPCPMCAGAIVQSRIPQVIYGTGDPKAGCAGTLMNLLQEPRFNHRTEVIDGVLQEECASMLTNFFRSLRRKDKETKE